MTKRRGKGDRNGENDREVDKLSASLKNGKLQEYKTGQETQAGQNRARKLRTGRQAGRTGGPGMHDTK